MKVQVSNSSKEYNEIWTLPDEQFDALIQFLKQHGSNSGDLSQFTTSNNYRDYYKGLRQQFSGGSANVE